MSHELTKRASGKIEMAYVGEKPWHGLGQELQDGATVDTWIEEAGMDWTIQSGVVKFNENGVFPGKQVLYRSDDHSPLSIVSDRYRVVQPRETLEFFRDLTEEQGFKLTTAGTLFNGKKFWALAETGADFALANDQIKGNLLLSTSCDGSLATEARFTAVRVVCNNTLSLAVRDKVASKVRHIKAFNPTVMKEELGLAKEAMQEFSANATQLADTKLDQTDAETFLAELLADTKTVYKEDPKTTRQFRKIMELYNGDGMGAKLQFSVGTAWGLLNAVTEFVDHHAKSTTASSRMDSAWFGRGDNLKTEALTRALNIPA